MTPWGDMQPQLPLAGIPGLWEKLAWGEANTAGGRAEKQKGPTFVVTSQSYRIHQSWSTYMFRFSNDPIPKFLYSYTFCIGFSTCDLKHRNQYILPKTEHEEQDQCSLIRQ